MERFEIDEEGYNINRLRIEKRGSEYGNKYDTWTLIIGNSVTGIATFKLTGQQVEELKEFINRI